MSHVGESKMDPNLSWGDEHRAAIFKKHATSSGDVGTGSCC